MSCMWVRIDGYDGYSIGSHDSPTWETLADGGCGTASVTFDAALRAPHHALRRGSTFEIMYGSSAVYLGKATEFDRQAGTLHAKGLGLWLFDVLALDGGGATTRDVGVALTQAIASGRWWGGNPEGVGGVVDGDATGNPVSIGQLLTELCEQTGQHWGTDALGRVYLYTAPTEPTWITTPDAAAFGETTEDAPTFLAGRYVDGLGVNLTAFAGTPGIGTETAVDLTDRGALTEAQAQGILGGMLTRNPGRSWVNGVELTSGQIATSGGTPAFLPSVSAIRGQLMRSFGIGYAVGGLSLDTLIGKTVYTAGASTIRVDPLNKAPRSAVEVWAA